MALRVPRFRFSIGQLQSVSFANMGSSNDTEKELVKLTTKIKSANTTEFNAVDKEIHERHLNACVSKSESYLDPETGYMVMTGYSHLKRGKCCGNECRHCPYDHINVPLEKRSKKYNSSFYTPASK